MLKREVIATHDGSTTIHLPEWKESYHSKHGAITEAYHVFIKNGFALVEKESVSVLEIGLGTGLNAFITALESEKNKKTVHYTGIEAYPVSPDEAFQMNYPHQIDFNQKSIFEMIHTSHWEQPTIITPFFQLTKRKQMFQDINDFETFDLIYFDAFGFRVQPELWEESIFKKMYSALKQNGLLVTYACRTSIKNAMLSSGFSVEKCPGAPGKREMLRAYKGNI